VLAAAASVGGRSRLELPGCGPITAAKLLAQIGPVDRSRSDAQLARHAGVAWLEASSGRTQRHRLDRGGNRQLTAALYRVAITQARYHPGARAYIERKRAEGKSRREAIRCLKRLLVRVVLNTLKASPALHRRNSFPGRDGRQRQAYAEATDRASVARRTSVRRISVMPLADASLRRRTPRPQSGRSHITSKGGKPCVDLCRSSHAASSRRVSEVTVLRAVTSTVGKLRAENGLRRSTLTKEVERTPHWPVRCGHLAEELVAL
jgi:hypothetical protein